METISGPLFGYWLACYTVATEQGHYAYGKLCVQRPRSVWEVEAPLRKLVSGPHASEADALDALLARTRRRLSWRAGSAEDMLLDDFDPL